MENFIVGDKVKIKEDYPYYCEGEFIIKEIRFNVAVLNKPFYKYYDAIYSEYIEKIKIPNYKPRKIITNNI